MSIISAILLGIVQGLAEFLPISSSGHLSIIQNLFGGASTEGHMLFDVLLHLGTLASVCVVYWGEILGMIKEFIAVVRGFWEPKAREGGSIPLRRLMLMIIIGTLPLVLVLPIHDMVEKLYYCTWFIGIALILTGCMLYISDRFPRGRKTEKNMTVVDALIIGVCQAVATVPGLSRSGTTISAALATGQSREFAVKYSFLLSLPAILGANILSLFKALKTDLDASLLPAYLLGMLAAAVVGFFAISLMKKIASSGKFGGFAYYCWGAGVITIILSIIL